MPDLRGYIPRERLGLEWLTDNVERVDGSPRGDGPDKSTVRRAIARENLGDKVIISRRERNPEAQA